MKKNYETLGVMIDFSRNGVMTLPSLKSFLTTIRKMGYNTLFLYMEDTYEIPEEPYFGYMRSRYTVEELREIDDFCASIGIEAIPCIQTLAHIKTYIKWDKVPVDYDDIMLVGEERTYELIANMFKTLSSCFRSRRIHIGMDEAYLLGRGEYYHKYGHVESEKIIKEHLDKICKLAEPYDYKLLLWSDMFFRSWNGGRYFTNELRKVPDEAIAALPKSVIPVYWDYYRSRAEDYDAMLKMHAQFSPDTWFAGGAWCWEGFAPLNQFSINSMSEAMKACRINKTKNIFMTMWGDDGMECSHFSQLPALHYIAECARGNFDEEKIKAKFKRIVDVDYDDFMKCDLPNLLTDEPRKYEAPSKYMLYSDPFVGFLDYTVKEGAGALYGKYRDELYAVAKKTRKYGYVFNTLAALSDVLEIKYELGTRTRKAYKAGDKAELMRLAKEDYTELSKRVRNFYKLFERQWYIDNKPSGMEIHDGRLGALIARLDACRRRLAAYAEGRLDKIDELEVDVLPVGTKEAGEPISYPCYGRIVSPNVLTHSM